MYNIFPSYDWDDAWLVNQIINLPDILDPNEVGFLKGVPNEEIKKSDEKIKEWIKENMKKMLLSYFILWGENI